ncbi:MAG: AraC family transcriptional regulator [Bacteroidetes bacterium]|nr:AraC family transcriptional regulator [Bacteroidota bacterium]
MLQFSHIIEYIFILGAGQGILLSVFLFKKKENIIANRLLAFTMIAFSIDLLMGIHYVGGYYKIFPEIIGITQPFPYLYGPSIYLYTLILGHKKDGFKKRYWLHYLPFIIINIYGIFFFFFESPEFKLNVVNDINISWHLKLIGNMIPFHGVIYVVLTYLEAKNFNAKLKQSYSNVDQINLRWLAFLIVATTIIWGIVILSYVLNFLYGEQFQANMLIYIAISIFIYSIGYKSLRQPEVKLLIETANFSSDTKSEELKSTSYKKSGLSSETADEYLKKLLNLMHDKKPYVDNKINLSDLSSMLGISSHNLSEIINTKLNQNFYDFINNYRVEEVKKLIEQDKNMSFSILALGYDAGFSSKSAFYSAFKKFCNQTPAQYREELRN